MFPIVVILLLAVIVGFMVWGMRGRGKLIECPECGEIFKRPAFAEKISGFGLSLPGIGDFTCPKCDYRGSTSSFRYVDKSPGKTDIGAHDEDRDKSE